VSTPAGGERYLATGEHIVMSMRKHPLILLGPLGLAALAMFAAAALGFVTSPGDGNDFIDTVFGMIALIAVGRFAWKLAHWWSDRIYVTPLRVFEASGILTRRVASMPLERITDMTYSRSIAARLLGYGSLTLETAGQDQGLSELDHLPKPDDVYRRLTSLVCSTPGDGDVGRTVFQGARIEDEDTGPLPRISL
jgi:membrane protein YdbS with pleckstrin-like domain